MIKMRKVFSSHAQKGNCPYVVSASSRFWPLLKRIPSSSFINSVKGQQCCALYRTHQGCVGSRFVVQNSQCSFLKHYKAALSRASPPFSLSLSHFAMYGCFELQCTLLVKEEIGIPKLTDQDPKDVEREMLDSDHHPHRLRHLRNKKT